ncbi:extracellular solute-binding protein [Saccharopolyspora sp. K220]|uniref:ABC transporter substrate-binding protein n=1 Tax=Saccharopolyspora soli TaxID=2926618 RepID=UPI001F5AE5E0|nr:extracellular solute-binding protein [Saccharopolyspora soli]MCI2421007.1 extracellular solute-binding protein [Saccharopolyspora soli]
MRCPSPLLALFLIVGLAVAGCSSGAADGPAATAGSTTGTDAYAAYANLTGPDRTAKLLEAAKSEGGEVDIYTSNTDIQNLIDGFQKAYPDIKVNAFRANSETVLQRILQESSARKIANDVVDTNEFELRALSKEHVLAPYNGPAKQNLRPDAIYDDWQAERFNGFVIGWNTSLVPEGQAPKSFTDLADPKWRGKVALELGDWDWYATMHTYLTDQKHMAPEAVDQLFRQVVANSKVTKGHTVQGELLSAGQFAVAASIYNHTVDNAAADGAPVAWHPVADPVILRPNGLALMAQPRHPAAALLWADWVLSEGQKVIAESNRIPAAENVPGYQNPIPPGTPVYEMPESAVQQVDMWNKAYDDLLRGAPQAR